MEFFLLLVKENKSISNCLQSIYYKYFDFEHLLWFGSFKENKQINKNEYGGVKISKKYFFS